MRTSTLVPGQPSRGEEQENLLGESDGCIVEADESTRKRTEGTLLDDPEDHIAGKGINSLNHFNLVHI